MIVYDLSCTCGSQFEGWFQSGEDFLKQQEGGFLSCPVCSGRQVKKILSPVSVKCSAEPAPGSNPENETTDPEKVAARVLRNLQDFVMKEYEDVGARLARESLEIKYGLKEPRNIRGVSTAEEEKLLKKEGIELVKIPLPAKEDKKVN
ncbi:MAG: DUF1178 family protein [Proteobacteria bacterium]|nr:DUF1178 family protein [Pseudomonadota bacterium]MBU1739861.1 DUF1178 family protein [Pseudomonadota bacterium]